MFIRTWIAVLMFIGCFNLSIMRINFSVVLLVLSENYRNLKNERICDIHKTGLTGKILKMETFLKPLQVSAIFAAYDLGASVALLFTEYIGKKIGYSTYIGMGMLLSAVFTMITPIAIELQNFYLLVFTRFLMGALLSPIYPMMIVLMTNWSPANELNVSGVILYGSSIGTFMTIIIYGNTISLLKYVIMIITGIFIIVWCVVWLSYVKDDPSLHPRITEEELFKIIRLRAQSTDSSRIRKKTPWKEIMRSSRMRALIVLMWCNTWNLTFFMYYMPMYYNQITTKNFIDATNLASLPMFFRFIGSIVCLPIIKCLLVNNMLSLTPMRKLFTIFSHIIPGTIALATLKMNYDETVNIIKMIMIMMFNGAFVGGGFVNVADLTPHFASSIFVPLLSFLSISGVLMPFVVGLILENNTEPITSWSIIMGICGIIYLIGGIVYITFGSASLQSWDIAYTRWAFQSVSQFYLKKIASIMLSTFCKNGCLPTRVIIAIAIFFGCFFNYMLRVNMSINIIAMVEQKTSNNGKSHIAECRLIDGNRSNIMDEKELIDLETLPDYGVRYEWNSNRQGLILGAYFWGAILTSIPGGFFAERFGPTVTVGISFLIGGIVTILTPLAASWSWIAVIIFRFVLGLSAGVCFPSFHSMISRWVPPDEKGKFSGALFGGTVGTVFTWPLTGSIIENWGWKWAFCVQGGLALIFCCFWMIVVSDSPETHKRISKDEQNYIIKCLGDGIAKVKAAPPYVQIFKSIPFWALAILHFGNVWGLYLLLTAGPKYMSEVLGFNLGHSGVLAALPYLARSIMAFLFGFIGDKIRQKNLLSVTVTRKSFVTMSHFIPGLLLLAILLAGCDATLCVILITSSLGFNGASTITNIQNNQDLSPNFAGTIYGIINCIGSTTGFFTPMITGYLTSEHNGLKEWHTNFAIGASVYIGTGIVYCIFGSGERQPWNEIEGKPIEGLDNPVFTESPSALEKSTVVIENTKV